MGLTGTTGGEKDIAVLSEKQKVKTLIHEWAHGLLHGNDATRKKGCAELGNRIQMADKKSFNDAKMDTFTLDLGTKNNDKHRKTRIAHNSNLRNIFVMSQRNSILIHKFGKLTPLRPALNPKVNVKVKERARKERTPQ